jgi:hypothetical protein
MNKTWPLVIIVLILYLSSWNSQKLDYCSDFGGGEYVFQQIDADLNGAERDSIRARLDRRIAALIEQGKIDLERSQNAGNIVLHWPLVSSGSDYGYHAMKHFVDHDPVSPNSLLDYNGGTRTYDLSNDYDHAGTDWFLWPFTWHKMDNEEVQVVAAAPGIILDKDDGYFDKICGEDPGLENWSYWNAVYIYHEDGSEAWYGHLKKWSLTTKGYGDSVAVGEFLGYVGSSGYSWEPHLHFELYDGDGYLVDPYVGPVNPNPTITWAAGEQRPYYDSAINKVMTHSAPPDFSAPCPTPATIYAEDNFDQGDLFYVAAYYRDQLNLQTSQYTIYKPDDSIFQSWTHNTADPHLFASYWFWGFTLPVDAPAGTWKFEVVYEGQTYEHEFFVQEIPVLVQAKVFLEGAYDSENDEMSTSLQSGGYIPTTSPYSEDQRQVSSIPADITDWVLVQLRETESGPVVASRSAFLHKDGRIVADDGITGQINLDRNAGNYYIVIRHNNHLAVMSATTISLNGVTSILYNFTSGSDQFYGTGGAKEMETGVWGMYGGNADNANNMINIWDYISIRGELAQSGYHLGDVDLSGVVNIWDYIVTRWNLAQSSTVP